MSTIEGLKTTNREHKLTSQEQLTILQLRGLISEKNGDAQNLNSTEVLVTKVSKGNFCITNSEGHMLSSTFLVTKGLTIEITDSYPIWRLLRGHLEAELLKRTLAGLLLQIGDYKDRTTHSAPTDRDGVQSVFKFIPEAMQKNLRIWGCWVNPYCDTWGCLNKRTQEELCSTCTYTKALESSRITRSKPRSGTSNGYQTISTVGTPMATRHPIDVKHEPTKPDTVHGHFQFQRPRSGTHKHNKRVNRQLRGVFTNLSSSRKTHKTPTDRSHFQSHNKPNSSTQGPLISTVSERTPLATRRSQKYRRAPLGLFAYPSHLFYQRIIQFQSLQRKNIVGFKGNRRKPTNTGEQGHRSTMK